MIENNEQANVEASSVNDPLADLSFWDGYADQFGSGIARVDVERTAAAVEELLAKLDKSSPLAVDELKSGRWYLRIDPSSSVPIEKLVPGMERKPMVVFIFDYINSGYGVQSVVPRPIPGYGNSRQLEINIQTSEIKTSPSQSIHNEALPPGASQQDASPAERSGNTAFSRFRKKIVDVFTPRDHAADKLSTQQNESRALARPTSDDVENLDIPRQVRFFAVPESTANQFLDLAGRKPLPKQFEHLGSRENISIYVAVQMLEMTQLAVKLLPKEVRFYPEKFTNEWYQTALQSLFDRFGDSRMIDMLSQIITAHAEAMILNPPGRGFDSTILRSGIPVFSDEFFALGRKLTGDTENLLLSSQPEEVSPGHKFFSISTLFGDSVFWSSIKSVNAEAAKVLINKIVAAENTYSIAGMPDAGQKSILEIMKDHFPEAYAEVEPLLTQASN